MKKSYKSPDMSKFVVFIFCWGRPEFNNTYNALRHHGYTGRIILLVDDLDPTYPKYIEKYGNENTYVFNKRFIAKECDSMNNFGKLESTLYVENAMFDIAKDLGVSYFVAMCDDYLSFCHKQEECERRTKRLDEVFLYIRGIFNKYTY